MPHADKRSADQDTAVEKAFVTGTLPEKDRRANRSQRLKETKDRLRELREDLTEGGVPTRGPAAEGNRNNPIPAADRTIASQPAEAIAIAAIGAAEAQIENELIAEERRTSDPRFERDQEVYEMGQRGELGFVPPAPEEVAAAGRGLPSDVIDELPKTSEEQADRDMARLEEGKEHKSESSGKTIR